LRCIKQSKYRQHVKTIDFTSDTDPNNYEEEDNLGDRVTIFREIVEAFPNTTTLAGLNLRYETFAPQHYETEFTEACANLTNLDLTFFASMADFNTWIDDMDYLQAFQQNLRDLLANTTHLTILDLSFGPDRYWQDDHIFTSHGLWHIIPRDRVWPALRRLSINYIAIAEKDIVDLLQHHSATLVAFNFGGLVLFKPSRKKGDDWSMRSGKMHTWRKRAW
jgi:hypothetical protein